MDIASLKKSIKFSKIISFDLFDTLFFRPYLNPNDLFSHLGIIHNAPGFKNQRIIAEDNARLISRHEEITLDEIYDQIQSDFASIKFSEMELELDSILINLEIKKVSDKEAEEAIRTILSWMGEDPKREGLLETPKRVVKAFKEYFQGYNEDAKKVLDKTFGDVEGYSDMVVQKNISVQSHCEHHMAPIIGKAHVAYIPNERVVGLSKIARVVEIFSKRLQTQERLTVQIANTLMEALDAKGVAVTIDSTHQCMTMRGIKKEQATTVTNFYLGQFKEDLSYQNRYLRFISTTLKD